MPDYPVTVIETELVVVGGGLAGLCAAVAAARQGARVVLIQDRSVLGGNASSEIKMHAAGADCHGGKRGARESGLIEEFLLEDAVRNRHRSYSQWDLLLYEKAKLEPNITLLLDTDCTHVETITDKSGKIHINAAYALCHSSETAFRIIARYFADCTGDGRLGSEAGADYMIGREAKTEFGETLARDVADRQTLGSSILFTARKFPTPQPFIAPNWIRTFSDADLKLRWIPTSSYEYGYWWFEWGGQFDTIKDNELIRHELLRIALGVWDYVKNSGQHPKADNWALDWVGAIPGKRESRRFCGHYIIKEDDILSGRIFDDQIAYGGWAIDLHPPAGVDAVDEQPYTPTHFPHLYSIPLRACHSRNVANLFFAGRNLSATHVAFASTRVMKTCSVIGQAVGTTAALWLRRSEQNDIAALATKANIQELQQTLLRNDLFLLGVRNEDPADLARIASVSASSEQISAPARNVINGITRDLHASFGAWSSESIHHWESAGLPATLTFTLPTAVQITEVDLTFDSGFERELTLSASDTLTAKMVRGPQPETVKHYRVRLDGVTVVEERGNYLRKRSHSIQTNGKVTVVSIEILATHGIPNAKVFEVRLYE